MSKSVSIVNSQDAVGKSTTAWFLARNLAAAGHKTLLVDCDPLSGLKARLQKDSGNVNTDRDASGNDAGRCFLNDGIDIHSALTAISERMDALVGNADLVAFEVRNVMKPERELMLRKVLGPIACEYDYVVIDTPSSLGLLTINALAASDCVIVPMCCDYFGMDGMSEVMRVIKTVSDEWNSRLQLLGLLLTRCDGSLRSTSRNIKEFSNLFGGMMMNTVIRESENPDGDYAELVEELLHRNIHSI